MASLDGFLMRAARLPRLASDVGRASALGSELLKEAVELLPQHVERSTEIAMAVGRVGSLAEPTLVKRFAEAYQQLLSKRLPESQSFSKAQAREARRWKDLVRVLQCSIYILGKSVNII